MGDIIFYIFSHFILVLLMAVEALMIARVVMGWFFVDEESALYRFAVVVTEPFVIPFRVLLERFEFVQNSPFDLSFFVAMMVISILQFVLPV